MQIFQKKRRFFAFHAKPLIFAWVLLGKMSHVFSNKKHLFRDKRLVVFTVRDIVGE